MNNSDEQQHTRTENATLRLKVCISAAIAVLIIAQLISGISIGGETVALVAIAILPWLSAIADSFDLPGGGKVQFRRVEAQVEAQKKQLELQQKLINQLVIYSMSHFIFQHLKHLYHRSLSGQEYLYRNNEAFQRDLRYLRDHGYLEHFNVRELEDGSNLIGKLKLTPVGAYYVEVREAAEQGDKTSLANHLRT